MDLTSRDRHFASDDSPAAESVDCVRLSRLNRGLLVLAGSGLVGLLLLSRLLVPDPSGLGTHQQLGLPPCGFVEMLGRPCPSCGMTTAWALLVRGQLAQSMEANAGGFLLAAGAIPAAVWLVVSGFRGCWTLLQPSSVLLASFTAVTFLSSVVQWFWRL